MCAASGSQSARNAAVRTARSRPCSPLERARAAAGTPGARRPCTLAGADTPGALAVDLRSDARGSRGARPRAGTTLQLAAPLRRLRRRARACSTSGSGRLSPSANCEEPRPEVVVLALEKRACRSAGRASSSTLAVDEHRRVEEGRAEERVPAHRRAPGRASRASRPRRPCSSRSTTPRPDDAERGSPAHAARAAAARRVRHGDVVRVEARDVASLRDARARGSATPRARAARRCARPSRADREQPPRTSGVASVDASSTTISSRSESV